MPAGDRYRTPCRFCLPVDLVRDLEAEAAARGIAVERLVDEIALALLPEVFAETVRDHIAESIRLAAEADRAAAPPIAALDPPNAGR